MIKSKLKRNSKKRNLKKVLKGGTKRLKIHQIVPILAPRDAVGNDQPIEIKILDSKTGSKVFEGFIPKSALSNNQDFVRITFEINRTINPHEINPLDPTDRPLGIAMDRIKIMPAKEYEKTQDQISIEGSSFFSKKNFQWKARLAAVRVGEKFKSSQKQ